MLVIRRAQLDVLAQAALEKFERRLAADLSSQAPSLLSQHGADGLLRCVHEAVARARSMGLVTEPAIQRFVLHTVPRGAAFWEEPRVRDTLEDPGLSPEARLNQLVRADA